MDRRICGYGPGIVSPTEIVALKGQSSPLSSQTVGHVATVDVEGNGGPTCDFLHAGTIRIAFEVRGIVDGLEPGGGGTIGHQIDREDEQGGINDVIGTGVIEGIVGLGQVGGVDGNVVPGGDSGIGYSRRQYHEKG